MEFEIVKKIIFRVYTDGSCRPKNPGGGYSACILINRLTDTVICKTNVLGYSTNNRAEMVAILSALELLLERPVNKIELFTDSQLCSNILNGILHPKEKMNLKANRDLVTKLKTVVVELKKKKVNINITWVKRNSLPEMIYADFLAGTTTADWTEEQTIKEFIFNINKEIEKHERRKRKI